jgi:hypothetical protein
VKVHFDECFDEKKVLWVAKYLPAVYATLDEFAPWRRGKWPAKIKCMTDTEIFDGRRRGAGHGYVYPESAEAIFMNPFMSREGHLLVLIHECIHVGWSDMTEQELNCSMLPRIWKRVTGKKLDPDWARGHGIGAPAPGIGDRSYCR